MTLEQFADVFGVLAVQKRERGADEITIRAYYDALEDLPFPLVAAAARRLSRTNGFFPRTDEWRDAAVAIAKEREESQRAVLRKLATPLCTLCGDTGFVRDETADRVTPCACRTVRERQIAGAQELPALPPGRSIVDDAPITAADAAAFAAELEAQLGKTVVKPMTLARRRRDEVKEARRVIWRANIAKAITAAADAKGDPS